MSYEYLNLDRLLTAAKRGGEEFKREWTPEVACRVIERLRDAEEARNVFQRVVERQKQKAEPAPADQVPDPPRP